MALANPTSKVVYIGNGDTTSFAIPFLVEDDELVVFRRLATAEIGTEDEELGRELRRTALPPLDLRPGRVLQAFCN